VANSAINRRNANKVACSTCGQLGLQWVSITDPTKVGAWDSASPKTKGWKYVPYGSEDFSGTVHALRPETCTKGSVTASELGAIGAAVEAAIPAAPVASNNVGTIDSALINARLDMVEANMETLRESVNDNAELTSRAIDNVNDTIANMGKELSKLANAPTDKLAKRVDAIADEIKALSAAKEISISVNAAPAVNVGRQHYMFANFVAMVNAIGTTGVVFAAGERGSGKSSLLAPAAKAMGYDLDSEVFKFEFNPDTNATDVYGYKNAAGVYVPTGFREAYVKRSLVFVDELPRAMGDAVSALNSITDGMLAGFPDGLQHRHAENLVFAGGNTSGRGASDDYEGNKLDSASLSRLVYLPFDTDWSFMAELHGFKLKGHPQPYPDPGKPASAAEMAEWVEFVYKVANLLPDLGIKASTSSRALGNGLKLLAAGICRELVEFATIWGHMSAEDALTVKAAI